MADHVEQLCERAKAGDAGAAADLIDLFYARIYAFLRRLCGGEDAAADLTQRTFQKAWRSLASFAGRSSFSTWLHGIAGHVYADWRRARRPVEVPDDQWWEDCPAPTADPFETVAERDSAALVYAAVEELGEDVRQTVHLHYYQGLSLSQTAEALGVATSTVKYRLREGLDTVRARFANEPSANPMRRS